MESCNPLSLTKYFFLSLCLILSVCFYAVRGIGLEPAYILFKIPWFQGMTLNIFSRTNSTYLLFQWHFFIARAVVAPQLCFIYNLIITYRALWYQIGNTYAAKQVFLQFTCYYVSIGQRHALSYLELNCYLKSADGAKPSLVGFTGSHLYNLLRLLEPSDYINLS